MATASFNGSGDYAGGFNGRPIANFQVVDKNVNTQAARLAGLPVGVAASVDDSPSNNFPCTSNSVVNCSKLSGYWVKVDVGGGATFGSAFQVQIKYYSGTPSFFVHVYTDASGATQQETILPAARRASSRRASPGATKTNTATIYTFATTAASAGAARSRTAASGRRRVGEQLADEPAQPPGHAFSS